MSIGCSTIGGRPHRTGVPSRRLRFEAYRRRWIRIARRDDDELLVTLAPIVDPPEMLAHITTVDQFTWNHDRTVWGSPALPALTYLQTTDFVVEGYFANDFVVALSGRPEQFVRLDIDTAALRTYRHLYVDPETLADTPEEFGHSFAVHGGIPWRTITGAAVIEVPAREAALTMDDAMEIPTAADVRRMTNANRRRIDAWLREFDRAA